MPHSNTLLRVPKSLVLFCFFFQVEIESDWAKLISDDLRSDAEDIDTEFGKLTPGYYSRKYSIVIEMHSLQLWTCLKSR